MRIRYRCAAALLAICLPLQALAQAPDSDLSPQEQRLAQSVAKIKNALRQENSTAANRGQVVGKWADGQEGETSQLGFGVLKALGLCVGVFLIGVAVTKRYRGGVQTGGARRLRVVERVPLSSKTHLVIAEVEGNQVLLAVGPDRVSFGPELAGSDRPVGLHETMEFVCPEELKLSA